MFGGMMLTVEIVGRREGVAVAVAVEADLLM